jgi:hypothetical protein
MGSLYATVTIDDDCLGNEICVDNGGHVLYVTVVRK